jgi:hypothetical protein
MKKTRLFGPPGAISPGKDEDIGLIIGQSFLIDTRRECDVIKDLPLFCQSHQMFEELLLFRRTTDPADHKHKSCLRNSKFNRGKCVNEQVVVSLTSRQSPCCEYTGV